MHLHEGHPVDQVFAPATADMDCFEPMTGPADALRRGGGLTLVEAGESSAAAFSITAERD